MTIDINKQYVTRDGRAVRILCTDAPGENPVIALLSGNYTGPFTYTEDGNYWTDGSVSKNDLIEKPTEIYRTVGPVSSRNHASWGVLEVGAYTGSSMEDLARRFIDNKIPDLYKTIGVFDEDGYLLRVETNPNA